MRLLRSFAIAFSMYSRIPVPEVKWEEADMKYVLAFFPFVGIAIAISEYLIFILSLRLGTDRVFTSAAAVCIPLVITGGIHMDGYMDMSDALSSYRSAEERLRILKDPHIGAFAVIKAVILTLLYFGGISDIISSGRAELFGLFCLSFTASRIGCAAAAVCCRSAKDEGTLYSFVKTADKKTVIILLLAEAVTVILAAVQLSAGIGIVMVSAAAVSYIICIYTAYKELGGLTGDTAGWMLCIAECSAALSVTLAGHLLHP